MIKKLFSEFTYFKSFPSDMKTLLITNILFALVLPVVEIFIGAYIIRSSNDASLVATYQLAMYIGVALSSLLNGFLLKVVNVKILFSLGILLSGVSMLLMMYIENLSYTNIFFAGILMGLAAGLFWTNRYLLALNVTTDENRNYFFGLETFFFTISSIVIPLAIGAFIGSFDGETLFGITLNIIACYKVITSVVFLLTVCAVIVLMRGNFKVTIPTKILYVKFHTLWKKQMLLAALKGMVQGFLVTAPAILVMTLVGNEEILGVTQAISGVFTAILVYLLGRLMKPEHRIVVFSIGMVIFLVGTLVNGILFSSVGVLVFVFCKVIFQPLHDLAYFPIMMKVVDTVAEIEKRDKYVYIMNHEFGLFLGRAFGLSLFIFIAWAISEVFALKYVLIAVALIQMLSITLSKNILKTVDYYEKK